MNAHTLSPGAGRTVETAGLQTHYHDHGEGYPIVLLHGSGPGVSAWQNWRGVIPRLADRFRVIAPDMAGFGATPVPPDQVVNIKVWNAQLVGLLDALGLEKAMIVGNSFGGGVALTTTLRHAERIDRLVLMGTPAGEFVQTEGLRSAWYYEPSETEMRRILSLFPHDPSVVTDALVRERFEASAVPGAQEAFRRLIPKPNEEGDTIVRGVPEAALRDIAQPTLVLHGREDPVIPLECGLRLHRNIPNSDLHVFGRCGHWVMLEKPDPFVRMVRDFAEAAS